MRKKSNLKHKEKRQKAHKEWVKNNPERVLYLKAKHIKSLAEKLNVNSLKFSYALRAWSVLVRKRDKICLCGKPVVIAHHIFHKSIIPELALEQNNGIGLCEKCHYEVHCGYGKPEKKK